MIRYAVSAVRGDLGRSLATILTLCLALISCGLLTGFTMTERVDTDGELDAIVADAPYHLLVRPSSAVSNTEHSRDMVGWQHLGQDYGGLTTQQWRDVQALADVEIAAPAANVGVAFTALTIPIATDQPLDDSKDTVLRFTTTTSTPHDQNIPGEVFVGVFSDSGEEHCPDVKSPDTDNWGKVYPLPLAARSFMWCTSREDLAADDDNQPNGNQQDTTQQVEATVTLPIAVVAVDPDAEAALTGAHFGPDTDVDVAKSDNVAYVQNHKFPLIPTLFSTELHGETTTTITVDEFSMDHLIASESDFTTEFIEELDNLPAERRLAETSFTVAEGYQKFLANQKHLDSRTDSEAPSPGEVLPVNRIMQRGPISQITAEDGTLMVNPVTKNEKAFKSTALLNKVTWFPGTSFVRDARGLRGTEFDILHGAGMIGFDGVGTFTPTETLHTPGDVLNPAGYPAVNPGMKIPLDALETIQSFRDTSDFSLSDKDFANQQADWNLAAPISAIRVKVRNITGNDDASQERLRLAAQKIRSMTGADVDIVAGSSETAVAVSLPPGPTTGRVTIEDRWLLKGVTIAISEAIDRKSTVLLGCVLIMTLAVLLLVSYSAAAAHAAMYRTLAAVGWSGRRIIGFVLSQQALLGAIASVIAASTVAGAATVLDLAIPTTVLVGMVPTGILLSLAAGVLPALRTTRKVARSGAAAAQDHSRKMWSSPRPSGIGVALLAKRPVRAVLVVAVTALSVASVSFVLAVQLAYSGGIVGSALGDAMAVQVRVPDLIAVGLLIALGCVAVYALVHLGAIEDRRDLGVLTAVGWARHRILGVVTAQALLLAIIGAGIGVASGLSLLHWFSQDLSGKALWVSIGVAGGQVVLAWLAPVMNIHGITSSVRSTIAAGTP